ncbi:hypothetical protein [Moorena bouillonii]|nr:hypothetical protein [Moorena bouillonii]
MPIASCLFSLFPIPDSRFPIPDSLKSKNYVPHPINNCYLWKLNLIQT